MFPRLRQIHVLFGVVVPICALACAGCGRSSSATAHLAGTVTIGGKPLPGDAQGTIIFKPASGETSIATAPILNGQYDSPSTPTGALKVFFNITKPNGRKFKSSRTGVAMDEVASIVPARYAAGIDLQVEGDVSTQNFDLAAR